METEMTLSWLSDLGKSVFGSMDGLFYTLVAFVVIDYITGVCVAIHNKQLSSDVGAHGIAKKIAIFALVSLSSVIDRFLLGSEDVLRTVTTVFYIANGQPIRSFPFTVAQVLSTDTSMALPGLAHTAVPVAVS